MAALTLAQRIQNGEIVPIEELKTFLLSADKGLERQKQKRAFSPKATDVDFF